MLRLLSLAFIVLLLSAFSAAQVKENTDPESPFSPGHIELGASGSFGSMSASSSSSYSSPYYSGSSSNEETTNYFCLSLIPAFYLTKGLAVEPETDFFFIKDNTPDFSLLLNLSYTFYNGDRQACPFFRAGYGITNSMKLPLNSSTLIKVSDDLDIKVLNFGAGIKIPLGSLIAVRTEVNYRIYSSSGEENDYGFSREYESKNKFLSVLLGFSLLI